MKNFNTREKFIPNNYVNKSTGECLESEYPNISSINVINPELVVLDSLEYVVIDSKALDFIVTFFSDVEIGRILKMANMVKGQVNVLYNMETKKPHTSTSLMQAINYSKNKFDDFMKKLLRRSIIYYMIGVVDNEPVKHILLNPRLARKTKTYHKDCLIHFENITEEKVKQKHLKLQ